MDHLSQAHLNCFEKCPLQFQKRYLDRITDLSFFAEEEKMQWGKQFHLLMQQRELGFSLEDLGSADNPELIQCLSDFVENTEEVKFSPTSQRFSEYAITLSFQDKYLLTAIYDLLIVDSDHAKIFDWKTHQKPPARNILKKDWQTRLYLYLLVESLGYIPEQVSMTYFFVKMTDNSHKGCTFNYSQASHDQTKQDLLNLTDKIEFLSQRYLKDQIPFSHLDNQGESCYYCQRLQSYSHSALQWNNLISVVDVNTIPPAML